MTKHKKQQEPSLFPMRHIEKSPCGLLFERLPLAGLADKYGTPLYVYSWATMEHNWRAFDEAFNGAGHLVCFAVKACSNLSVLAQLVRLGSGFDIVSGGELARVIRAGAAPDKVVFSGVGKTATETAAALDFGIACFNVESRSELNLLETIAAKKARKAPIAIRVNPDVEAGAHAFISTGGHSSKFGVSIAQAKVLIKRAAASPNLGLKGLSCHVGSQIHDLELFRTTFTRMVTLADELHDAGIVFPDLNFGGGLGIRYLDESPPEPQHFVAEIRRAVADRPYRILIEPGRAIVGDAGLLLTRVLHLKAGETKNFAIVDAAMSEFMRPALYGAKHAVLVIQEGREVEAKIWDVVGPICESSDVLAWEQRLSLGKNDLLAILSTGAYGFVLSHNYNTRPRVAEVLIHHGKDFLIRRRETITDLVAAETSCKYWQKLGSPT